MLWSIIVRNWTVTYIRYNLFKQKQFRGRKYYNNSGAPISGCYAANRCVLSCFISN